MPMRSPLLHVAMSGWLLGQPSGANRRLLAIAEQAGARLAEGERLTVLHRPDYTPPTLCENVKWQAIPIRGGPTRRRIVDERRHLARALERLGANVLDHGFLPLPKLTVPSCLLLHDLRAAEGITRWPRWLARRVLRGSCARAAAIVVPSQFTARRLHELAPGSQPVVIPNGATSNPATDRGAPDDDRGYLLHVGHLEARKNVEVVLRALARLPADERPDLVLVGRDAGRAAALRRLGEQLGITGALRFRGVVDDETVAELGAAARAVVVPSPYEGFGLPAIDALAAGRPALVAAAGALPEVTGTVGVHLPADDVEAWATAIAATAVDDVEAAAARRAHAAQFSWSHAATATVALWRRLAEINAPA